MASASSRSTLLILASVVYTVFVVVLAEPRCKESCGRFKPGLKIVSHMTSFWLDAFSIQVFGPLGNYCQNHLCRKSPMQPGCPCLISLQVPMISHQSWYPPLHHRYGQLIYQLPGKPQESSRTLGWKSGQPTQSLKPLKNHEDAVKIEKKLSTYYYHSVGLAYFLVTFSRISLPPGSILKV